MGDTGMDGTGSGMSIMIMAAKVDMEDMEDMAITTIDPIAA